MERGGGPERPAKRGQNARHATRGHAQHPPHTLETLVKVLFPSKVGVSSRLRREMAGTPVSAQRTRSLGGKQDRLPRMTGQRPVPTPRKPAASSIIETTHMSNVSPGATFLVANHKNFHFLSC